MLYFFKQTTPWMTEALYVGGTVWRFLVATTIWVDIIHILHQKQLSHLYILFSLQNEKWEGLATVFIEFSEILRVDRIGEWMRMVLHVPNHHTQEIKTGVLQIQGQTRLWN